MCRLGFRGRVYRLGYRGRVCRGFRGRMCRGLGVGCVGGLCRGVGCVEEGCVEELGYILFLGSSLKISIGIKCSLESTYDEVNSE